MINDWVIPAGILAALVLLGKLLLWIGKANEKFSSIENSLVDIKADIKKIFLRLPETPVKNGSPVQLTDLGEKIAEWLEAEKWASELAEPLLGEISEMQPFQVDEFCVEYVKTEHTEDLKERVAMCAYEFGIDKEGVRSVLRVVLRDKLLESMKVR